MIGALLVGKELVLKPCYIFSRIFNPSASYFVDTTALCVKIMFAYPKKIISTQIESGKHHRTLTHTKSHSRYTQFFG